jgi:hypothetical protein
MLILYLPDKSVINLKKVIFLNFPFQAHAKTYSDLFHYCASLFCWFHKILNHPCQNKHFQIAILIDVEVVNFTESHRINVIREGDNLVDDASVSSPFVEASN